jgi:hypothetical protein
MKNKGLPMGWEMTDSKEYINFPHAPIQRAGRMMNLRLRIPRHLRMVPESSLEAGSLV